MVIFIWILKKIKNKFCINKENYIGINIGFFSSHADEIEPSHVEHASLLINKIEEFGLKFEDFKKGYVDFKISLPSNFIFFLGKMRKNS